MQNESNTQELQQEVERLKKELQSLLDAPASDDATPKPAPEKPEGIYPNHPVNQIKLSLRCADEARTLKEEGGVPASRTIPPFLDGL